MSEFQKQKVQDRQKPFPGCMGRMINMFDLNAGMAGANLLTDKAHRDGSPVHRNQSDVKKAMDSTGVYVDDKQTALQIASNLSKSSSSKRPGGTPVKMLMAQEMSRETEMKRKPPSVVARLMGLDDDLPVQKHVLVANKGNSQDGYSNTTSTGSFRGCRQLEDDYFNKPMPRESAHGKTEYKDVYEVWQQPSRTSRIKDQHQQNGRCNKDQNEKRIALVHQKFMEAKRLAIDEELLQSKEFRDALEVLSSNKDLFIKFLEEPNSLFSKKIRELYMVPPAPQTKCITILKPSKTVETKGEKLLKRQQYPTVHKGRWETVKPYWSNSFTNSKTESLSQPTRIVVLKPSPGKPCDMKMKANPLITSTELLQQNDVYESLGDNEAVGPREVAKEITWQMQESLSCHRRDESFLSSVHSNGYVGDESSFYKSENEYMEDECGSISDSETVTPTSRYSWDYTNRFSSPYSASSFSRASCSPESSVIREAKKRLSERLALVASNETGQEQIQMPGSLSTLGEILAIPGVKKEEGGDGGLTVTNSRSCGGEDELRAQAACLSIGRTKVADGQCSPQTLSRSKSVPVSSSVYESIRLSVKASDSEIHKPMVAKPKNGKSSFRAKFSSFFFSKSKKASREKPVPSPSVGSDDIFQTGDAETIIDKNDDSSKSVHNRSLMECPPVNLDEKSACSASATPASNGSKQGSFSFKATISHDEPRTFDNLSENQDKFRSSKNSDTKHDQPSPTSVLDAPLEDDANDDVLQTSDSANAGQQLSRSPAIESVTRSLSWDDVHQKTSSPNSSKLYRALSKADVEGQELVMFVQKLLSSAGLDSEKSDMVFSRWYSVDSPLNPILLDKFLDQKEEEAKSRERRSNQRLLFDWVNAALLEIGQATLLNAYPWKGPYHHPQKDTSPDTPYGVEVWGLIRNWFSGERKLVTGDDNSILVVDGVLRREVEGRGWAESMKSEIDEISTEIGREILEDLVREALPDFTGTYL
ncbi:uncharacterized protein LOC120106018 isoform X1 [Phoenix dactylifera]|uniref:Uncharacterized protein LOC120106018 isoform X1 n=1 Tax=Phoenix dactylifera TaxID=42345 RepID=A0A8B8ZTD7_PHODC|nr:uncharacterized protein LOC120106018 isoform X1 [Phoenix dactylifera]XP_038974784.1 uncharacterized protein LOC120106018 isoform X1 [Phoenix dactylifera]XP_038974785.1 uncharacterized protein LOC120106018 isoform X1 [Phoenix dactylifera]